MTERLVTVREASLILGLTEKAVIDLANEGIIPAYKIAGEFLRFREDQIQNVKEQLKLQKKQEDYSFGERLSDFLYFNDFYILSITIIILILFFIFK